MSEFLEKLKNKVTYYIHNLVNDDDANKYAEEQHKKEPSSEHSSMTDTIKEKITNKISVVAPSKEQYDGATQSNTTDGVSISGILRQISDHTTYFIQTYFYWILALFLASFVANDLIMYPAGTRVVGFIFIFIVCGSSVIIANILGLFYFGRKLYEMYINSGIDVTDSAYVRYSPKIFALLPVTTKIYDSVIANFFLYPFRYLKDEYDLHKEGEDPIQKDSEILKKIMGVYTTLLADSYPDVEKIKKDYPDRTKEYDTFMDKLHAVVKPKENEEDNADKKTTENTANNSTTNNSTANNSTETQLKKKIEEYDAEIKKLSDIKVIPFYKPDGSENTSVQETHKKKIENLTKEKEALEAERNNLIHMYDTEIEKLQKDKLRLPGTVFYRPGPDEKNNTRNKKENTRDSDKINGEIQKLEKKKTALGTKPSVPEPNGATPEPSAPPL